MRLGLKLGLRLGLMEKGAEKRIDRMKMFFDFRNYNQSRLIIFRSDRV